MEMVLRITSDIPSVSLGDIFTSTTIASSEVPTPANVSTKNNHITGESFTIFKNFMFYLLYKYLLHAYHLSGTVTAVEYWKHWLPEEYNLL